MTAPPRLHLGSYRSLSDPKATGPAHVPAHHLVTHGVVTGMTGSGKTGLLIVTIEEALRASGGPAKNKRAEDVDQSDAQDADEEP